MDAPTVHRVGLGTDVHRLEAGRPLRLGGVEVPFDRGLSGHSDGDVVLHAVTDAILGAAGLPDIGEQFPDSDPQNRDRDSREFLSAALELARARGFSVVNLDLVIHAERPKLSPYKTEIRDNLAEQLALPPDRVSVKAKTAEGLDAIGRGDAIGCTAIVGLG